MNKNQFALLGTTMLFSNLASAQQLDLSWMEQVEFFGLVEFEAQQYSDYDDKNSSDFRVATVEFGLAAQLNPWVSSEISFLYEQDDTELEVDTAIIHVTSQDQRWLLSAGQQYLPFGRYETQLISGPLTQDLAETRETALLTGFNAGNINGAIYGFNGDNGADRVENFGAVLGYGMENETDTTAVVFEANVGYINDIGDSDTLQEIIFTNQGSNQIENKVPGVTADMLLGVGSMTLIGEYTTALDRFELAEVSFNQQGAKPAAWNIEAGYGFEIAGFNSVVALGYQGSEQALNIALPEQRIAAALSVELVTNTQLSVEYALEKDYAEREGGTGNNASVITAQLAAAF